jgi:hypothetical protein
VLAAAAAVVVLGVGLGVALNSSSAPTAPTQAQGHANTHAPKVMAADLVENGHAVGRVVAFGGSHPWMSMMLADSGARGTVTCVVETADGVTHKVGTFVARDGYGAWIAPLHVDPATLRSAEVVSPDGAVIATATLS